MDRLYVSLRSYAQKPHGLWYESSPKSPALLNRHVLGMSHDETIDDPNLGNKRNQLVTDAAQKLASLGMINYNQENNSLQSTDLGQIAAKYYTRYTSIEIFNQKLKARMSEADVLAVLSMSTEVSYIHI